MHSRRPWSQQEDNAISQLVVKCGQKNWTQISTLMVKEHGFKTRTGKQCRERWHNHLNPQISKKIWTREEEQRMFKLHQKFGNKWTTIAENLPGRTDNSIKNYFYSTIRRSLRRMSKMIGSKNSTTIMKQIKPSALSKIFAADKQLEYDHTITSKEEVELYEFIRQNCSTVREQITQFSYYKPKRKDKICEDQKRKFTEVIEKTIKLNRYYERLKKQEKKLRYEQMLFHKGQYNPQSEESEIKEEQDQESSEKDETIILKNTNTRTRNVKAPIKIIDVTQAFKGKRKQIKIENQNSEDLKSEVNYLMPTVIVKPQQDTSPNHVDQLLEENNDYENPEFYLELKEESVLNQNNSLFYNSSQGQSPGFFLQTPHLTPFNFFQSPRSSHFSERFFGVAQAHDEEYLNNIKRQIEHNTGNNKEDRKMQTKPNFTSPCSAFKHYT